MGGTVATPSLFAKCSAGEKLYMTPGRAAPCVFVNRQRQAIQHPTAAEGPVQSRPCISKHSAFAVGPFSLSNLSQHRQLPRETAQLLFFGFNSDAPSSAAK